MPTIIDSLVVRLGLDSKGLNSQAPQAGKQIADIEKSAGTASTSVKGLGSALTGMLAIIGGTVAIRHFTEDLIDSNAALDRFSKNIGLNVSTVSAWGNAVEEFGGNAKSVQGTLDMLSKAQTELKLTGESSLIPYFSMMGISMSNLDGSARKVTDELADMASFAEGRDRTTMHNMFAKMGIDEGTINLMLQGRRELEINIRRQEEQNALTKEQGEQSVRLQRQLIGLRQSFVAFGQSLLLQAGPALERMLATLLSFGDWVRANSEFVGNFLKVLGVGLGAIAIASLPLTGTGAIIGALAAAIALLWQDYQTWKKGGESLIDWGKWQPGIELATKGLKLLGDAGRETLGVLQSIAKLTSAALGGKQEKFNAADIGLRNKVRGWFGAKPLNEQQTSAIASANKGMFGMKTVEDAISQIEGFNAKGKTPNRPQRNHNPGDIEYGPFARAHGATGSDGRFAIFPDDATGKAALSALLRTPAYSNLTLEQAVNRFAPPTENNTKGYVSSVAKATGAKPTDNLGSILNGTPGATNSLAQAGGSGGTVVDRSVSNRIDNLTIQTQATDAPGIMRGMRDAMDNLTFSSQANPGLN